MTDLNITETHNMVDMGDNHDVRLQLHPRADPNRHRRGYHPPRPQYVHPMFQPDPAPEDQNSSRGRGRRNGRGRGDRGRGRGRGGPSQQFQVRPFDSQPIASSADISSRARMANSGLFAPHINAPRQQPSKADLHVTSRTQCLSDDEEEEDDASSDHLPLIAPSSTPSILILTTGHSELSLELIKRFLSNHYECVICHDKIGRKSAIWSCDVCYLSTHRRCILQFYETKKSETLSLHVEWPCPGCLTVRNTPIEPYSCFCAKVKRPESNHFIVPHSCGDICGKVRGTDCPHICPVNCHPGPCPKCSAMGPERLCPCGRSSYRLRCGDVEKQMRTCDAICGKFLDCKNHRCTRTCHNGDCDPCSFTEMQTCCCGKMVEMKTCGSGIQIGEHRYFTCKNPCEKLLDCGLHRCSLPCHSLDFPCPPCSSIPTNPQPCACGKVSKDSWSTRKTCLDDLPHCDRACNRPLGCGKHNCQRTCHSVNDPCGDCTTLVRRTCRCTRTVMEIPCSHANSQQSAESEWLQSLLICDSLCGQRLSCKKHVCQQRCCSPDDNHLCLNVCGKQLACGNHTCDSFCHSNRCPPCSIVHQNGLLCACRRTRTKPNVPCGTPVTCSFPCKKIRACGHECLMSCHLRDCDTIAPCAVLTTRKCAGNHKELRNIPCYAKSPSCGVTCSRLLPCGLHNCKRPCHDDPCVPIPISSHKSSSAVTDVFPCNQKCGSKRMNCEHSCKALCHIGSLCPDVKCDENVTLRCSCGRLSKTARCNMSNSTSSSDSNILPCDGTCEVEKRNNRFREAFGIGDDRVVIPYPSILLDAILEKNLFDFCVKVEEKLKSLVYDAPVNSTKMLNPMTADQRWLVHQISPYYDVRTDVYDEGPRRSVRLWKLPASTVPSTTIQSAIKIYLTQRQSHKESSTINSSCLLHFYGLNMDPSIHPSDLNILLKNWEGQYRLNWVDHTHAFAVFPSADLVQSARTMIAKKNTFVPRPWRDATETELLYRETALYRKAIAHMDEGEDGELIGRERRRGRQVITSDGWSSAAKPQDRRSNTKDDTSSANIPKENASNSKPSDPPSSRAGNEHLQLKNPWGLLNDESENEWTEQTKRKGKKNKNKNPGGNMDASESIPKANLPADDAVVDDWENVVV